MDINLQEDQTLNQNVKRLAKENGLRAVDVLREVMILHNDKMKDIITQIMILLEDDPRPSGTDMTYMYKQYAQARDIAVDCANKLAPYESAKLQSMEVKTETTHKFVMRTPITVENTEEWMKMTGATLLDKPQQELLDKHNTKFIEDIEEVEAPDDFRNDLTPEDTPMVVNNLDY